MSIYKISVISVVLNENESINECLNSFKLQNYNNKEHIIIDGGSIDGTIEIVEDWCLRNKDAKYYILRDSNIYEALNYGIQKCSGDIIGILHANDFYPENSVLNYVVKIFNKNNNLDYLSGGSLLIDKNYKSIRYYHSLVFYKWMLYFGIMPSHTSSFFKKKLLIDNLFNTKYRSASDFDFFIRIMNKNYFNLNDSKCLMVMRNGGTSTNGVKSYIQTFKEQILCLKENNMTKIFLYFKFPLKYFLYTTLKIFFKK